MGAPLINYGQATPLPVDPVLPDDATSTSTADTSASTSSASVETAVANSTASTTADSATSSPAVAVAVTTPDTAAATAGSVVGADPFADDAFSQGWFDDSAAWPHVIGWALAFAVVWYGAYWLAKRRRNAWVGLAVGIVPFIVVLYFLYENINRLLPAAI